MKTFFISIYLIIVDSKGFDDGLNATEKRLTKWKDQRCDFV